MSYLYTALASLAVGIAVGAYIYRKLVSKVTAVLEALKK